MATKKPSKEIKKPRKKKDPSPPSNVVEVTPPELSSDRRVFLDSTVEIIDSFPPKSVIKGYAIYAWTEEEDGTVYDMVGYNRGQIHPYLFPDVVKKALERFM